MYYKTVSLPEALINEVKGLIELKSELGFTSTAEFVKEAIRENIKRYHEE